jgi:mono/diheme cytochrome c family protein
MLRYFFTVFILGVLAVVSLAGFRGVKSTKPPIEIFPDMDHQPRIDAQAPSTFFADGRSLRAPIAGTVPLGYSYPGSNLQNEASNSPWDAHPGFTESPGYVQTGKIGAFYGNGIPFSKITPDVLMRGQQRFTINCQPCHGATGEGNGIVTKYGMVGVANFQQQRLRDMPDGQIFNTITNGKNTMAAYGPNITVEDRWAIITYIRALQKSQQTVLAGLPPEDQKALQETAK